MKKINLTNPEEDTLSSATKGDTICLDGEIFTFVEQTEENIYVVKKQGIKYQYNKLKSTLWPYL